MILIVTQAQDPHVDYLIEAMALNQRRKVLRFNTEDFPNTASISLGEESSLAVEGEEYNLRNFSSVLYRRPGRPLASGAIREVNVRKYCEQESWEMLLGLWEYLDCLWVSKPSAIKAASYKWEQLKKAAAIGFQTPRTLITNDPVRAKQFCRSMPKVIVKPVSRPHFETGGVQKMVYANPIGADDPRIQDIELSPMILQAYVPKQLELRITVVGTSVFACAIHSQKSEKTTHDWRHYDLANTPHETFPLPEAVRIRCIQLVKNYGLNFGAIDMVLTPSGEYVFLEINPNGQWLWIEELTQLNISSALIELLFSRE